jgi:DNA-binding transcriptional ArsR family regulator
MTNERISQVTAIARAIADETRVRLLMALRGRELCVCQLQAVVDLAPSTVSEHLLLLRQAGLVKARKAGRWVYYALSDREGGQQVRATLQWLEQNLASDPTISADNAQILRLQSLPADEQCCVPAKVPGGAPTGGIST